MKKIMNYRINTKIVLLALVLFLTAVTLFVYILIYAPANNEHAVLDNTATTTSKDIQQKVITAKHKYENGIHTIAGKADVPTTCHRLFAEPFYTNTENRNDVVIKFNTALDGKECLNQISDVSFNVLFEAPENANITATWDGDEVRLNLIPLQPGETIDSEIYMKG